VSSETGWTRLHLFHPVGELRVTRPESTEDPAVLDFKFSPDGRFVAYRLGDSPIDLRLAVAPSWEELSFDWDGSVTDYGWSPDASTLAVFLSDPDGIYVSGADVSGGASAIVQLERTLTPANSSMAAVGDGFVAFHAGDGAGQRKFYYAELMPGRFGPDNELSYTVVHEEVPIHFRLGPGGFFAIQPMPAGLGAVFFQVFPEPGFTSHNEAFVSASGAYVAQVAEGTLTVFPADTDIRGSPWASGTDCSYLLAWAKGTERLACLGDGPEGSRIHIFELNPQAPGLTMATVGGSSAGQSDVVGWRRAFSPDGRWFAFSTADSLYTVDWKAGSPEVVRADSNMESLDYIADLAFSPDGRYLLQHRGPNLFLHSLEQLDRTPLRLFDDKSTEVLADPSPCEEDFDLAPDDWCGSPQAWTVVWSPDAQTVAFRTSSGMLEYIDFRSTDLGAADVLPTPRLVSDSCRGDCLGQYDFQP
jgi:WD40 repeat protein